MYKGYEIVSVIKVPKTVEDTATGTVTTGKYALYCFI